MTVELKNDISIRGVLKSVDQFLNIKLNDIEVVEELKYPHLVSDVLVYCIGCCNDRTQVTLGKQQGCIHTDLASLVLSQERLHPR